MANSYVIARGRQGRPTLMHKIKLPGSTTACGVPLTGWSRAYMARPILEIPCRNCEKLP